MRHILLALLLLAGLAGSAHAQPIDMSHGGPITVTSRDGMDWRQNQQEVVARGDARAVRDNVTVTADELVAHYRKKATPPAAGNATPAAAPASPPAGAAAPGDDTGSSEIYRLEAFGHVHIFTATDQAWGDKGVYDMDQAVLVLTGHALKVTTPNDIVTARDSMEYWSQTRMSVARGKAVLLTSDARRIAADTLVSYSYPPDETPPPASAPAAPPAAATGKPPSDDLAAQSGKLKRVEAYGNVDIRTITDTVYGDRGVYLPATGIARIVGHVRVTRGDNQVNGVAADVNMKTGVTTMLSSADERVHGLIMPNQTPSTGAAPKSAPPRSAP
jgi:lipopolysaccharide export system protein LptA